MNTVFCFSVLFVVETEQGYNFWFLQSDWSISVLFHCKGLAITFCYLPSLPPPPPLFASLPHSSLHSALPSIFPSSLPSLPPFRPPSLSLRLLSILTRVKRSSCHFECQVSMWHTHAIYSAIGIVCCLATKLGNVNSKSRMGASNNGCGLLGVTNNR